MLQGRSKVVLFKTGTASVSGEINDECSALYLYLKEDDDDDDDISKNDCHQRRTEQSPPISSYNKTKHETFIYLQMLFHNYKSTFKTKLP